MAFQSNTKNGDRASLRCTRKFSILFLMASISFRKVLKTVCFDCEMTLFGKTYSKLCVLAKMLFFLGIAGKNGRFCQNSLTCRDSVMVIFRFLSQNGLKLELRTFAVHKVLMEH